MGVSRELPHHTTELISNIIAWARSQDHVRALVLTGSLARNDGSADELSDIDIEIFADDHERYASDDGWMRAFGDVWMYLPLPGDEGYPNRLVIFGGGRKVDFSLRPINSLRRLSSERREMYRRGYRVLLDKDGITAELAAPEYRSSPVEPPGEAEFVALAEEFLFEAWHVAKYLKRGDLWTAKWRDWETKELLLRMLEVHARALHGPEHDTWHLGLHMRDWAEPKVWEAAQDVFGRMDAEDSWRALEAAVSLFGKTGRDAALRLGYRYPVDLEEKISRHILSMRQ